MSKALAELGHRMCARGWALGTSGNFSVVLSRRPLRLAITASGLKREKARARIDEAAAVAILQAWLDARDGRA